MMSLRVACIALLVGLTISMVAAKPGGKSGRHGRQDKPKPLGVYACSLTTEDGEVLKGRDCYNGEPCTLGPLYMEGRQNDTLTAYFCVVAPTPENPLPGVLRTSCLVETPDESILHERECPMTSECDHGPIEYATENGTAYAYFCSKPEEKPDHSKESPEDDEEEVSDEEESVESSEEVQERAAEKRRTPGGLKGRRQRRHAGGRRGRGFRRPRSLMSYACNVTDEEGETVRARRCRGDSECTLGPLPIEGKDNNTLTAYFCAVEVTEDKLLRGVVEAACLVETEDEILHERECPETSECDLGPLDIDLASNTAYAYFCTKPERNEDSSEGRRRGHPSKGKHSSEEDDEDDSSSEEKAVTEAPELPEGGTPEQFPQGGAMQGAE